MLTVPVPRSRATISSPRVGRPFFWLSLDEPSGFAAYDKLDLCSRENAKLFADLNRYRDLVSGRFSDRIIPTINTTILRIWRQSSLGVDRKPPLTK